MFLATLGKRRIVQKSSIAFLEATVKQNLIHICHYQTVKSYQIQDKYHIEN